MKLEIVHGLGGWNVDYKRREILIYFLSNYKKTPYSFSLSLLYTHTHTTHTHTPLEAYCGAEEVNWQNNII